MFCSLGQPAPSSNLTHIAETSPHLIDLHYFLLPRSSIAYTALLVGYIIYYGATTLSGDDFTSYTSIDYEGLCFILQKRTLTRNLNIQLKRVLYKFNGTKTRFLIHVY